MDAHGRGPDREEGGIARPFDRLAALLRRLPAERIEALGEYIENEEQDEADHGHEDHGT
jgi:hypothetical protein